MDNKKIFNFFLMQTSCVCLEFCTDFDEEAMEYRGLMIFKIHYEYLESLRIALGIE